MDSNELLDDTLFNSLYSTVSLVRQAKISSFHFRKDRNLCLGAGLLLATGLKEYGLREAAMTYITGGNGKPRFLNYPDIHFNISHSEDRVICAFSSSEVGCDIEKITPVSLDIAGNYFFRSEFDYIKSQPSQAERENAFFRLWTLKESFIKANGLGMSLQLDSFCISFDNHDISVQQNVNNKPYYFREYDCDGSYKLACCSQSNCFAKKLIVVSFQ